MDNILIELEMNKDPYIKQISNDHVINLTGESGSGKTYFSKDFIGDEQYIVIDTDIIFGKLPTTNEIDNKLRNIFIEKYKSEYGNRFKDALLYHFDDCYEIILDELKDTKKTIVIDSAQYRNMKDLSKLKGKLIILRTSVNVCYERCIKRFKEKNPEYTKEELQKYIDTKKEMYKWYEYLNHFIQRVDKL